MKTIIWILDKLGKVVSFLGTICIIVFLIADDSPWGICSIIGLVCAILGCLLGNVAWKYGIAPILFWAKSPIALLDEQFKCIVVWGVRFFMLPFIAAGIYYIITS